MQCMTTGVLPDRNTKEHIASAWRLAESVLHRGFGLAGDTECLARLLLDALDDIEQYQADLEELRSEIIGNRVISMEVANG